MIRVWAVILFNVCTLVSCTHRVKDAEVESILINRAKRDVDINEILNRMRNRLEDPVDEEHDELERENEKTHAYTWTVQLNTNDIEEAKKFADEYGFNSVSNVGFGNGFFRLTYDAPKLQKNDKQKSEDDNVEKTVEKREYIDTSRKFLEDKRVQWYKREKYLDREKRAPLSTYGSITDEVVSKFNDPWLKDEWYIHNFGQTDGPRSFDSQVSDVWKMGYTGKGRVLSVLDDGMDHTHPDLADNYDPKASKDLNGHDDDPLPNDSDPYNAHGTKCAGTIAAVANNGVCGVGIAHDAKVGAIRMLDGRATDGLEADALSFHRDHIEIFSCSWGPKDNGQTFGRPGPLGKIALAQGAKFGRNGKGSIFVWATGNGGMMSDDCNADGYVNSIYTLGIGSVNEFGVSTYYGERCPAIMAVTYCSGKHKSTSFTNNNANVITTYLHHQCTNHFVGTSSAAPLAAGILALVLEANPNLTWRDIQHLVYQTATKTSPLDSGWLENGCGKPYNHKFGFGVLNAKKLVDKALNWTSVAPQKNCHFKLKFSNGDIPSGHHFKLSFTTDGCQQCKGKKPCAHGITKLEHVVVNVTLKHRSRGDLSIDLISPSKTVSHLLHKRPYDSSSAGLKGWTFMTLFNWCENPKGTWQIIFRDREGNALDIREGRDMEEEYVHMLNKRKEKNSAMADDTSATVREEAQVYNPVKKAFDEYMQSKRSEDSYDTYGRRQSYNDDDYYYSKDRERRSASQTDDEKYDRTDYVKYKKSKTNYVHNYKDEVLKDSILAGVVNDLSVTFYGT